MTTSILPAIKEMERAFAELEPLFGKKLPKPIITIQSRGRWNAYGWYAPRIWRSQERDICEINLSAEYMGRSVEEIAGTLLHEMVHLANEADGIKDCTANQYHNKHFKRRAESVGLEVEQIPWKGWAVTRLGERAQKAVQAINLKYEAFSVFRKDRMSESKAPTKMKKWQCDCTIVRCAVFLDATCDACGIKFKLRN